MFESPHRLKKLLIELKNILEVVEIQICRELTKKFEEHIGNNIDEVINHFDKKEVLGEITIIIKGKSSTEKESVLNEFELKRELMDLINAGFEKSASIKILIKKIKFQKILFIICIRI